MTLPALVQQPQTTLDCSEYGLEMALFTEGSRCAHLLGLLNAAGVTPRPALTLADVRFVRRSTSSMLRSCSTSGCYGQVEIPTTHIRAIEPSMCRLADERIVSIAQIGEAAAYAALLELNCRRLRQQLALARLRRRLRQQLRLARSRRRRHTHQTNR